MDNEKPPNNKVTIYPIALGYVTAILLIFGFLIYTELLSKRHYLFLWFPVIIGSISIFYLYLVAWVAYSRIIITGRALVLPKTDYKGIPSSLMIGKTIVDVASVVKIRKINSSISVTGPKLYYERDGKLLIGFKNKNNVCLSLGFFGEQRIEQLIAELEKRNVGLIIEKDLR